MKRPGISVVEIIIAIGIAAIIIATVGNLIVSTHRVDTQAQRELQASALAKQYLEIFSSQANQIFGVNAAQSYTAGDGQTCSNTRSTNGFSSCWVDHAIGLGTPASYHFTLVGSAWQLQAGDDTSVPGFTRSITITNAQRDGSGNLVTTGGTADLNTKNITVTVTWPDRANTRQLQISSIVSAWKNF